MANLQKVVAAVELPPASCQPGNVPRAADVHLNRNSSASVPLLVDLDQSLIKTDMLHETALAFVSAHPFRIATLIAWAAKGRAQLKRNLALSAELDANLIPINEDVAAIAAQAKNEGRPVYLVTASDETLAAKIANRLGHFDGIICSNGVVNLKGRNKLAVIRERFPDGFDYIGDSAADLHIWRSAREVIAVAPGRSTRRKVQSLAKPTTIIPRQKTRFSALIKAGRLHQWAKNALIFVPAILSGTIADPHTVFACVLSFIALGLVATGTYLINDLFDIASDRRHWSKRFRPIASGDLPISAAILAGAVSIGAGLALGTVVGTGVVSGLAAYLVLTLAYSFQIKRIPILDVVVLAALFTLRLAIGIAAAQVFASPWLLVFSMFLFTSLSVAKRYTEIQRTIEKGGSSVPGRGYVIADAPLVLGIGLATGTASILILVLYLIFDAFSHSFYGNSNWLWSFPLILFLWISRIWLLSQRGELDDDPVAFALKDQQSLLLGGVLMTGFLLAWIGIPL